jgi:hypothetical protein
MILGPVEHGQPDLPPAKNLENFRHANTVFSTEVSIAGNPSGDWYDKRRALYMDPVPHVHKLWTTKAERVEIGWARWALPVYHVFVDADGTARRYTEVESRRFYCRLYAKLASHANTYLYLRDHWIANGYNIQIAGYTGRPIGKPGCPSIEEHYLDGSQPFGHELILYTMLTTPPDHIYPWDNPALNPGPAPTAIVPATFDAALDEDDMAHPSEPKRPKATPV